jgi:GNAT superfamily N-acetyltransferase
LTAYRFCRTDDMGLLVDAYERCRGPEDAGEPALDREGFKRLVRELDLWCSSCMVALESGEPVGVLFGAKRPDATLVRAVRVHPEHRRRGHGRHLLTSLGQKLAILGPARLVAEIPAERVAARALFGACAWRDQARLVDWRRARRLEATAADGKSTMLMATVSLDEVKESGLLERGGRSGYRAWERDLPSLLKEPERLLGLGFHSTERLEAFVLARPAPPPAEWELVALGASEGEVGILGLRVLVTELDRRSNGVPLRYAKVAPEEVEAARLTELGFAPAAEHRLFATEAKAA